MEVNMLKSLDYYCCSYRTYRSLACATCLFVGFQNDCTRKVCYVSHLEQDVRVPRETKVTANMARGASNRLFNLGRIHVIFYIDYKSKGLFTSSLI